MRIKLLFKNFFLIIFGLTFAIFLAEGFLRLLGYLPWKYEDFNNIGIYEKDNVKGWISKKGIYEIIAPTKDKSKSIKILDEGGRYTGKNNNNLNKILFIGGSFTQGWGVNDDETFSFKLQNQLANYKIKNYGQGGYSGVQSLLLLDEVLEKNNNTKLVIYGYMDHHEYRNVARGSWLGLLLRYSSTGHKNSPKVPYAILSKNGSLVIKKPIGYLKLPLREKSALVTLTEKTLMKLLTKKRKKIQKQIVKKVALNMKELSNKKNAKFVFLNLKSNLSEYIDFFNKEEINFVDCNLELTNKYLIKGDYHPNGKAHTFYSNCIFNELKNKNLLF